MRTFLYYSLMLLVGFAWFKYGQKLLRQGHRDKDGQLTKGPLGPVGFLVSGAVACYVFFVALRALARGEVSCVGKGCAGQVYTLAASSGEYWANVFYLVWIALAMAYAMYVTFRIWFRT